MAYAGMRTSHQTRAPGPSSLPAPTTAGAAIPQALMSNVYEGLVEIDQEGEIQPLLAESWELSEDRKTYTFKLREGATFSNGEAFTAEDVKFSIERVQSDAWVSSLKAKMDVEIPSRWPALLGVLALGVLQHLTTNLVVVHDELLHRFGVGDEIEMEVARLPACANIDDAIVEQHRERISAGNIGAGLLDAGKSAVFGTAQVIFAQLLVLCFYLGYIGIAVAAQQAALLRVGIARRRHPRGSRRLRVQQPPLFLGYPLVVPARQ